MSDKPDFTNLYRGYQIQAAESVLDPSEDYYYRKICRWYSETFHTPLTQVYTLSIDHVLQNYYESVLEKVPYNDLFEQVKEDFLPELVEQDDKEAEAYAKDLEKEQAITLARQMAKRIGANPPQPQQKPQSLTQGPSPEVNPSPHPGDISLTFDDESEEP